MCPSAHGTTVVQNYYKRMKLAIGATRVSDKTAFFLLGEVVEYGDTEEMFSVPKDKRTEDYITGRFG